MTDKKKGPADDGARKDSIGVEPATNTAPESPPQVDRVCEIERLAALEPIDYEVARAEAAEAMGVRASVLDREVAKKRRQLGLDDDNDDGQGRAVELPEVLPWHEPVEGDRIASALVATIKRYAVLSDAAADAIAIWILLSWCLDQFSIAPRLAITSPTKGCGKTTVLDLVHKLARRTLSSGSVTPAALFRAVELLKPTLLLDETEKFLEPKSEFHGMLNMGHRRGGSVIRVLGDTNELRQFDVFALVAFAINGKIPDDLEQRSIVIEMRRRLAGEKIDQLPYRSPHFDDLQRMCARWADDYESEIRDYTNPNMGGIINRVADNWRPLIAIADMIGADWPERIRNAAVDQPDDRLFV